MKITKNCDEVIAENKKYSATFGEKSKFGLPPSRNFAILNCIVARFDSAKYAELAEGEAQVIRNPV